MAIIKFLKFPRRLQIAVVRMLQQASPRRVYAQFRLRFQRERAELLLARLSRATEERFTGTVMVDAMWDNPNYWIRYALLRSALGLASGKEVGILGQYRLKVCRTTLERFGVGGISQIANYQGDMEAHRRHAIRLRASAAQPGDILHWQLPHGVPADLVYDGILKRQRLPTVNLDDPKLVEYVAEALGCIAASHRLLETYRFQLIVLSHAINFQAGSLAWLALARKIPLILLYGNYGVPRFARLSKPTDIYDWTDRPTASAIATLRPEQAQSLATAGLEYLNRRRAGQTDDIGSKYAFQKRHGRVSRESLASQFGWDPRRTIIAVYASNWFDMPHCFGMSHFRDFLDWVQATVQVAAANPQVNWLFKAHPLDDWYGGVTLSDLIPFASHPHVRLADNTWNNSAVMECVDALVTYHGTAGIEFAAMGKPVLLADRGWYHDIGLAKWSKSRQEYLNVLATDWWADLDLRETARRAQVFAGWHFARPAWQGGFVLEDDSVQWPIYARVPPLFADNPEPLRREVDTIRAWFHSDSRHYHTFKMRHSEEFRP